MDARDLLNALQEKLDKSEARTAELRSAIRLAREEIGLEVLTSCEAATSTESAAPRKPKAAKKARPAESGSGKRIPIKERLIQVADYLKNHGATKRNVLLSALGIPGPTLHLVLQDPRFVSCRKGYWELAGTEKGGYGGSSEEDEAIAVGAGVNGYD